MDIKNKLIILFTLVVVFITVLACTKGGLLSLKSDAKPGIADNEDMHASADDMIVGDSNVIPDPVSRVALANTRFLTGPLGMAMLRQTTVGREVSAEILNQKGQR